LAASGEKSQDRTEWGNSSFGWQSVWIWVSWESLNIIIFLRILVWTGSDCKPALYCWMWFCRWVFLLRSTVMLCDWYLKESKPKLLCGLFAVCQYFPLLVAGPIEATHLPYRSNKRTLISKKKPKKACTSLYGVWSKEIGDCRYLRDLYQRDFLIIIIRWTRCRCC
jgi:hypothetical protein